MLCYSQNVADSRSRRQELVEPEGPYGLEERACWVVTFLYVALFLSLSLSLSLSSLSLISLSFCLFFPRLKRKRAGKVERSPKRTKIRRELCPMEPGEKLISRYRCTRNGHARTERQRVHSILFIPKLSSRICIIHQRIIFQPLTAAAGI